MKLNADFTRRAVVHAAGQDFVPSPMPGVERLMLDRIGDEVARATTIVRYAPGSNFSPHTHDGGEEFLVLDGVFQDEHGDSPAGTYVRNPPGSRHQPGSEPGCTIFVKLRQFASDDDRHVVVDTTTPSMAPLVGRPSAVGRVIHEDKRKVQADIAAIFAATPASFADDKVVVNGDGYTRGFRDNLFRVWEATKCPDQEADDHLLDVARRTSFWDLGQLIRSCKLESPRAFDAALRLIGRRALGTNWHTLIWMRSRVWVG
ncbi:cupin domain-containing protein [uncultured Tateyamaria sp.]|uniref:cupin domain-containing protein n=1 Tax=uncultured Tateyamaria sp. TaxID=455651 RepID=UPI0026258BD6|nr:cupin domain-containing protein [uncultured Tateyamaria sp.]